GGGNNSYHVGNTSSSPAERKRESNQFLTYRVRSYNNAGLASAWSTESQAVATTLATTVVDNVSNYPNPFDTRKGGPEGKTVITYTLGADSDVQITIYDLLGYVVKSIKLNPGEMGARVGPNFVEWDGRNGMGRLVSKGGYIARIKVGSGLGTATVIRKIGVIH
ncbi:MAG: FlgD immunoglobulin-like domain containing protein, partial [Elusimicrobiota bacterium]